MALTSIELGPFGVRLVAALQPWITEDLERVCAAIGAMGFNNLLELIEEEGTEGEPGWVPAWGKIFDPDLCPPQGLQFLAKLVGVVLPVGMPEAEARALIKAESGRERGTPASIESAIKRNLIAGTTFEIRSRENLAGEPDPYGFVVTIKGKGVQQPWFTLKGSWEELSGSWENQAGNEGVVREAINRVKPAGLVFWIVLSEGTPWLDLEGSWENLTGTWEHIA
jgi:hypothetical protein